MLLRIFKKPGRNETIIVVRNLYRSMMEHVLPSTQPRALWKPGSCSEVLTALGVGKGQV